MVKLWWSLGVGLVLALASIQCLPTSKQILPTDEQDDIVVPGATQSPPSSENTTLDTNQSPTPVPGNNKPEFVNLIYPTFIGSKIVNDESVASAGSAIELQTRSGKYKIVDYDISKNSGGKIERLPGTSWSEPGDIMEETSYTENEMSSITRDELAKRRDSIKSIDLNLNTSQLPFWIHNFASCMVSMKGKPFQLKLRDNLLLVCDIKQNNCQDIRFLYRFNDLKKWFQVYSIEAIFDGNDKLTVIAFDAIGRVVRSNWRMVFEPKTFQLFSYDDPMVATSLSAVDVDSKPFVSADKVSGTVDEYFKKDFERKQRANFVEAISAIQGSSLPVLVRHFGNETNPDNSTSIVTPSDEENLGLCVANGYWLPNDFDYVDPRVPIMCRSNDKSIKNMIPSFYSDFNVIIYAFHFTNYQGKSYYHFFMSGVGEKKDGQIKEITQMDYLYRFVAHNETIGAGKDLSKAKYQLYELKSVPGNTRRVVKYVPNDIVGYYKKDQTDKGACQKVILFYDMVYSVHEPHLELSWPTDNLQRSDDLFFYINAAMSVGDQFYFFTHTNKMVVMKGEIPSCQNQLVFSDKREQYSQDFLMTNLFGVKDSRPYLLDYREITTDESQVRPSSDCPNLKAGSGSGGGSDSSAIIIIIIGLIIGGLILAGLLYVFCLRDHDFNGTANPTRSSMKSKMSPKSTKSSKSKSHKKVKTPDGRNPDHGLHALTVRSGVTSPLTSGVSSKATSPVKSSPVLGSKMGTNMNQQKSSRIGNSTASKMGATRSRPGAMSPSKTTVHDKSKVNSPSPSPTSRSRLSSPVRTQSTPSSKRSSSPSPRRSSVGGSSRKSSPASTKKI